MKLLEINDKTYKIPNNVMKTIEDMSDYIKQLEEENRKQKETIKELSLSKEIVIKGINYLEPPYKVTCKGSEK